MQLGEDLGRLSFVSNFYKSTNGIMEYPYSLAPKQSEIQRNTEFFRERYQMGRKIPMETIENKQNRLVSFSKRRKGLFKKAEELHKLTGSHIAVLVLSEAGVPYFHGSHSLLDKFLHDDTTSSSTVYCVDDDCVDDDHHHHQAAPQSSTGTTGTTTPDQSDEGSEVGPTEARRAWMSNVEINEANCDEADDLMVLKNNLECLKERVASKITAMEQLDFFESLLV